MRYAFLAGQQREGHFDQTILELLARMKTRMPEHLEHLVVVDVRECRKMQESVRGGQHRQALENQPAEAFALERVVDRHREFRRGRVVGDVGAGGDDARRAVGITPDQQGHAALRIGGVAQREHDIFARFRFAEKSHAPRLRREPRVEGAHIGEIGTLRQADGGRAAVAQDQPTVIRRVLVGEGKIQGAGGAHGYSSRQWAARSCPTAMAPSLGGKRCGHHTVRPRCSRARTRCSSNHAF